MEIIPFESVEFDPEHICVNSDPMAFTSFKNDISNGNTSKRHSVWEYFNSTEDKEAACLLCNYISPSVNTTNLKKHLECKHKKEFEEMDKKEKEKLKQKLAQQMGTTSRPTINKQNVCQSNVKSKQLSIRESNGTIKKLSIQSNGKLK